MQGTSYKICRFEMHSQCFGTHKFVNGLWTRRVYPTSQMYMVLGMHMKVLCFLIDRDQTMPDCKDEWKESNQ